MSETKVTPIRTAAPSNSYVASPLDDWEARAEAQETERWQQQLATRLRCPVCGELGLWYMVGCLQLNGTPIPDGAYCYPHSAPGGGARLDRSNPAAVMSLNTWGWLPDGSTWTEGFPRLDGE